MLELTLEEIKTLHYITNGFDSMYDLNNKLAHEIDRLEEMQEQPTTEWNGEGLPPVGIKCEAKHTNGSWSVCETVGHYQGSMVCATGFGFKNLDSEDLRPIKTEREKVAEKADELAKYAVNSMNAMYALYDAGMLKMPEGE